MFICALYAIMFYITACLPFIRKILWYYLRQIEEDVNAITVHPRSLSKCIGTSIKMAQAKSDVLTRTTKPVEPFEAYSHANCINTSRKRPANCFIIDFGRPRYPRQIQIYARASTRCMRPSGSPTIIMRKYVSLFLHELSSI